MIMEKNEKSSKVSAKKTGLNILFHGAAILLGAAVGAGVGRNSLYAGLAVAGLGYTGAQMKNKNVAMLAPYVSTIGLGMMVGTHQETAPTTAVAGLSGALTDALERAKSFGKAMGKKAYLDEFEVTKKALGLGNLTVHYGGERISESTATKLINDLKAKSTNTPGAVSGLRGNMFAELNGGNIFAEAAL